MAQGPIDYTSGFGQQSPFGGAVEAMQAGAQFAGLEQTRELRGLQMQELQQAQQVRQAQAAREQEFTSLANQLYSDPTRMSFDSLSRLSLLAPDAVRQKAVQDMAGRLSSDQRRGKASQIVGLVGAIQSGLDLNRPELLQSARGTMEELATAYENSGDNVNARATRDLTRVLDLDPRAVMSLAAAQIANLGTEGKEAWEAFAKTQAELRARNEDARKAAEARRAEEREPLELAKLKVELIPPSIREAIGFKDMTPDQQRTFVNIRTLSRPPAPVVNVSMENAAGKELGQLVPQLASQASSAVTQVTDIQRYKAQLPQAIVGPMAETRLGVERIASMLGLTGDQRTRATTELIQGLAEMGLQSRSMLTGQGAITDAEQKLLIKARSGDINLTRGELDTLLSVSDRAARAQYNRSTGLLRDAARTSETASLFLRSVPEISAPTPSAAQASQALSTAVGQIPGQGAPGRAAPVDEELRARADAIIRGGR